MPRKRPKNPFFSLFGFSTGGVALTRKTAGGTTGSEENYGNCVRGSCTNCSISGAGPGSAALKTMGASTCTGTSLVCTGGSGRVTSAVGGEVAYSGGVSGGTGA